jgi:hypothetical protein
MLFVGFIVGVFVGQSFYPKPLENEIGVCLHLSDYDNQTISYIIDLKVGWVRTDWLLNTSNSMRDYS